MSHCYFSHGQTSAVSGGNCRTPAEPHEARKIRSDVAEDPSRLPRGDSYPDPRDRSDHPLSRKLYPGALDTLSPARGSVVCQPQVPCSRPRLSFGARGSGVFAPLFFGRPTGRHVSSCRGASGLCQTGRSPGPAADGIPTAPPPRLAKAGAETVSSETGFDTTPAMAGGFSPGGCRGPEVGRTGKVFRSWLGFRMRHALDG
jgi:hypothetical protein